MIAPGIVKVAVPSATVAMVATGSAMALPDDQPKVSNAPIASSPLDLARETNTTSRDAFRPPLKLAPSPKATPKVKAPAARHVKKQAPIPKPAAAKTRAADQAPKAEPPKVVGSKYVTTALNVWTLPEQKGSLLTVLDKGTKVQVTGKVDGLWAEIVRNGISRWVKAKYLAEKKPEAEATQSGDLEQSPCKHGSSVENGLTKDAIRVHRAVCAAFPSITSYGGLRSGDSGSEHSTGRGLDIMVRGATGDQLASWLRTNAKKLGIKELIWSQRIWTVQRSSEGWRSMEDRGGDTANHYDHVHVSVYGNSGTV